MDSNDTHIYNFPVSVLTIPRSHFWLFKGAILELIYALVDQYEGVTDDDSIHKVELSNSTQNLKNLDLNEEEEEEEEESQFFHLAFTPDEVTLMCSSPFVNKYLKLPLSMDKSHSLVEEQFFIIECFNDGSNIGKRILELTKPLSQVGISLFFISNYFSDLVLVPFKNKEMALEIIEGSQINDNDNDDDNDNNNNNNNNDDEWESNIQTLKPQLDTDVKLVMTGARSGDTGQVLRTIGESLGRMNMNKFCSYFAVTLTPNEELALLITHGAQDKIRLERSQMMGSLEDLYHPLMISDLPLDATGIVSGVADKLQDQIEEMSYLSLGRSGVVLVPDTFASRAQQVFNNV